MMKRANLKGASKKIVWGTVIFMSLKGTVTLTLMLLAFLELS
jgi:hypothetical protein